MFKGEETIVVVSSDPIEKVYDKVEESLSELGRVTISKKGSVSLEPKAKYSNIFTDVTMEASVKKLKKPDEYEVSVAYNCAPSAITWIVAIVGTFTICIGFLAILLPMTQKSTVERDVKRVLASLEE
jgi:hypothetical protein